MGEFEKAKEQFLLSAKAYKNNPNNRSGVVSAHIQAAKCLAKDDNLHGALCMLRELLDNSDFSEFKVQLFKALAEISKDNGDIEKYFVYAEVALDIDPSDINLRFNLAYTYSENNEEKMAFLHYKKHTDTSDKYGAFNNLGVQYDKLKMPSKSVESYYKI